ncbi:MAG TPA: DUF5985 family protein [Edaphobacter sp.]|jgi:hypothetical protein|nr:DUF5985 family protein [Edaphobacter sp.]
MGPAVYILSSLVRACCAILLLRGYWRSRQRLLLWSGLCFVALTLSSVLLFLDLVILPQVDLYLWRLLVATIGMVLLLFGLIWEGE